MTKEVYLTIDDAPSTDFIKKIDFLKKNNIPAIVFCIGNLIESKILEIVYAIKKGFIIGNHSYSHKRFSKLSLIEAKEEIEKTDKLIELAYKKANTKRQIKAFRFPYGNKGQISFQIMIKNHKWFFEFPSIKRKEIQEILKKNSYNQPKFSKVPKYIKRGLNTERDTLWTYDLEEYILNLETIKTLINNKNDRQNTQFTNKEREILLIHDHQKTTKQFFEIINYLKKRVTFKQIPTI